MGVKRQHINFGLPRRGRDRQDEDDVLKMILGMMRMAGTDDGTDDGTEPSSGVSGRIYLVSTARSSLIPIDRMNFGAGSNFVHRAVI